MADKDVTNLIERLEAFEDRLGVSLEGLFATMDEDGDLRVNGELHLREGTELNQDVQVVATAYDSSGRVLYTRHDNMYSDSFFAFAPFSLPLYLNGYQPARVRVYPKTR